MVTFGLLGTLTFLGLFIYFYKTSGKFRKSIIAPFMAATVYFSGLTPAHSVGKADTAFTQQNQQHRSRPSHRSGFFSGRSSNDGSGPGKPHNFGSDSGGDGLPQFPQTESVEKTEERVKNIETLIRRMEESSDTENECESAEQLQVNESYKSNSDLKKITKNAHKSKRAVKNLEDVKQKLSEGVNPMEIGYKPTNLGNGFYYIRKPDARMIVKVDPTTRNSDIVAFGLRSNYKNMETLATVVNSQCDTKIKINPKAY